MIRSALKKTPIIIVCLLVLLSTSVASARWLWVKGEHKSAGCESIQSSFESALTTMLSELTQSELTFDGQLLACDSDRCAESRLLNAGGSLALYNSSVCIKGRLDYELRVINVGSEALVYLSSVTQEMDHQTIQSRAQELAKKLVKGPRVPEQGQGSHQGSFLGLSIGSNTPNIAKFDTSTFGYRLDYDRVWRDSPQITTRYSLSFAHQKSGYFIRQFQRLGIGVLYLPTSSGLSPWFGGGVSLGYLTHQEVNKRIVTPYDTSFIKATISETKGIDSNMTLRTWVETGLMLNKGRLQPNFSTRLYLLNYGDGASAELMTLFGVRWL